MQVKCDAAFCSLVALLFSMGLPLNAMARAGGGENYHSGSSSSDGSVFDLVLFFLDPDNWIALAIAIPPFGLLLLGFFLVEKIRKHSTPPSATSQQASVPPQT